MAMLDYIAGDTKYQSTGERVGLGNVQRNVSGIFWKSNTFVRFD